MSSRRLSRGRFVAAALALGGPLGLAPLRPWRRLVELAPRTPAERLVALLPDPAAARAVGAAYVRKHEGGITPAALVEALADGLRGGPGAVAVASDAELRALLAARSREDFAAGRTTVLRGWLLSDTDVHLCALASLLEA